MPHRVLVAEDEAMIAMLLEAMLQDAGYAVAGPCPSVAEALAALESADIDGALLDVHLRDGPVFPLAAALRVRRIPFAFLTGYGRDGLVPPWESCPCIAKPFMPEAVCGMVAGLFAAG